ncbi:MAG: hypothetical protein K2O91_10560 [Lachnospiraceae bacterium]|nr:hypothetical protein [Lachnospiraceae bacterium]
MKKLDFKSKKWDKELRNLEEVIKGTNGKFVEFHNLSVLGDFNTLPDKRKYLGYLSACVLNYYSIACDYYIMNNSDYRAVDYIYLSGISGILADRLGKEADRNKYQYKRISENELSLYELIATDEAEIDFFKDKDSVIYHIYCGNYDKAECLLQSIEMNDSIEEGCLYDTIEYLKAIYMAIIARNEELFNEELAKRIRKYRKNMVGYSTIIDVISIALIKMARKAEINYHLDVIEIPKIFFDKNYRIDKEKLEPVFYEEALEKCK